MTFITSIRTAFRSFATFGGTATRPEFWWFALFTALGHAALNTLNVVTPDGTFYVGASLSGIFGVFVFLPLLSLTVRRLRDAGRSPKDLWWLLLPVAGEIVLIVHLAGPSRAPSLTPSGGSPLTPATA